MSERNAYGWGDWTSETPHVQMPVKSRPSGPGRRWSSKVDDDRIPFYVKDSLSAVRRDQDAAFDRLCRRLDAMQRSRPVTVTQVAR